MTESFLPDESFVCPNCGQPTLKGANFCEICGSDLRMQTDRIQAAASDSNSASAAVTQQINLESVLHAPSGTSSPITAHTVAFKTDIGYKHHVNQDAGSAWTAVRPNGTSVSLIVVADGVSAGRNSEGASRLAVDLIEARVQPALQDMTLDIDGVLEILLETAKIASREVAQRPHHAINSADATTLVAAFCIGGDGAGVWCGDSRVYQFTGGEVLQLTRDHSWAEGVVSHGIMTREDAARDPRAHMITRWLGPPAQNDPGVESFRCTVASTDVILCCTDGLYMYFSAPTSNEIEMARLLARYPHDLQGWTNHLIDVALQRGGRDNITAAAIRVASRADSNPAEATTELPSLRSSNSTETVRLTKNGQ